EAFANAVTGKLDVAALGRTAAAAAVEEFHLRSILPRIEAELLDTIHSHRPGTIRTAAQAYQTAVLAEKAVLSLVQTQPVDAPDPALNFPLHPVDYNFFDFLPMNGKANRVVGPVRRFLRKLMIPMFQRLRDLLEYLDYHMTDNKRHIKGLEAA